jgi:hypothetical protein
LRRYNAAVRRNYEATGFLPDRQREAQVHERIYREISRLDKKLR